MADVVKSETMLLARASAPLSHTLDPSAQCLSSSASTRQSHNELVDLVLECGFHALEDGHIQWLVDMTCVWWQLNDADADLIGDVVDPRVHVRGRSVHH